MKWTDAFRLLPVLSLLLVGACAWLPAGEEQPVKTSEGEREQTAQATRQAELEAMFGQALVALEEGDNDRGRSLLERIHEERPDAAGVLLNLGIVAQREEDLGLARQWFQRTLEVDPGNVGALNRLAMLDRQQGDFEQAHSRYLKALERNPDHAPVLLNLAILLDIYLGRPGDALDYYQRYGEASAEPDPRLEDWIFDARQRSDSGSGG